MGGMLGEWEYNNLVGREGCLDRLNSNLFIGSRSEGKH